MEMPPTQHLDSPVLRSTSHFYHCPSTLSHYTLFKNPWWELQSPVTNTRLVLLPKHLKSKTYNGTVFTNYIQNHKTEGKFTSWAPSSTPGSNFPTGWQLKTKQSTGVLRSSVGRDQSVGQLEWILWGGAQMLKDLCRGKNPMWGSLQVLRQGLNLYMWRESSDKLYQNLSILGLRAEQKYLRLSNVGGCCQQEWRDL